MMAHRQTMICILAWMFFLSSPLSLFAQTLAGGECDEDITLSENTTLTKTITIGSSNKLTIDLNGYVLTKADGGRLFEIKNGKTLIVKDSGSDKTNIGNWGLDGEEVTIAGGVMTGGVANHGGAVLIEKGGKMEFLGGTIAGCRAETSITSIPNGCGGGIAVDAGGYLKISGGNIAYCQTELEGIAPGAPSVGFGGGAVCVIGAGHDGQIDFHFEEGEIYSCRANNGGGIYLQKIDAELEGNASISNCIAVFQPEGNYEKSASYGGGGIFVNRGSLEINEDVSIKGNKSGRCGMGLYLINSLFTMNGGTISNNIPLTWNNTSTHDKRDLGGGIYINKGTSVINGGTISANVASSGGGVMLEGTTPVPLFTMNGGVIEDNRAIGAGGLGNGGGVYLYHGVFNFNKGKFSGNVSRRYGGAININDGATCNLNGECLIVDNTAGHGGGISQEKGQCVISLSYEDIQIKNNKAIGILDFAPTNPLYKGNGGGLFLEMGDLIIEAGTLESNEATTGKGGGISLYNTKAGNINVIMSGGYILNNSASEGGGIDVYANYPEATEKNKVSVYLNGGEVNGNTAKVGGGVHIGVNPENSVANMYVGTLATRPEILSNEATNNGGGLAMNYGSIEVIDGLLTENVAANKGGGIYIQNGNFDIIGKAVISKNTANNGGGFCVEEGSVTIKEGDVSENTAHELGGGLYVTTISDDEQKTVTFDGGLFKNNKASVAGGGVAVVGNLSVAMNGNIEENTATNGGGIYLKGAKMDFRKGLIRFNQANGISPLKNTTGNQKDLASLKGMGGGIYLDSSSTLTTSIDVGKMGLYDNLADNGGDDIFANGDGTSITLPKVSEMELTGFGNAGELYWVEDYITDDTGYESGTNANSSWNGKNNRYREALRNNWETFKVGAQILSGYACLALGHEITYITILKEGLQLGESSIFKISKTGDYSPRTILLTGVSNDGKAVSKRVALTSGEWTVTETNWSWSYDLATPAFGQSITQTITSGSEFKFVNTKRTTLPLHDETKVENTMQAVKTE